MIAKELLEYSYKNKLSHIPSALSMLDYVNFLFSEEVVKRDDIIVIGKPFGAQAYYLIWQRLGWLDNIESLSVGVKHDEIDFVDYGEETMGNALGVAIGMALANPEKQVWVNITDATLQMGNTLEAIQFIGHNQIKNILLTIDYNNKQVTGNTEDVLSVEPIYDLFLNYKWRTQGVDGHSVKGLSNVFSRLDNNQPNVVFCYTDKGHGVQTFLEEPKKWHYQKIESQRELQSLVRELQDT
jgi:transketolase N-terminal domain/subunit